MFARAAISVLADHLDPPGRWRRRKRGSSRSKAGKQPKAPPQAEPKRPAQAASKQAKQPQAAPKQAPPAAPKRPQAAPKRPPQAETGAPQAAPQSAESAGWGPCTEQQAVTVLRVETDQGSTVSPVSFIGSEHYAPERVQRERKPGESRRVRRKTQAEERHNALTRPEYTPEMKAGIERMRARARGLPVVYPQPAAPPRRRAAGAPLAIARLAPATLMLLASGEPLMDAATPV